MVTFVSEPGYFGNFTREQADGAIPNGSRIVKCNSEKGDRRPDGTTGTVLGSFDGSLIDKALMEKYNARLMYFIEWDDAPRMAVGVIDWKLERAQ